MGLGCSKAIMGIKGSRQNPQETDGPGCVSDMRKKYGCVCVDEK